MINKNGQGSIAGLIFLVIIFILLYVLIMPPCDRCELLGGDCDDNCDIDDFNSEGEELLDVEPGQVSSFGLNESRKDLDDVNLFFDPNPYTKRLATSVDVSASWFGGSDKSLSFDVEDLDNIESASLLLDVLDSRGKLIIELNGHEIFSSKIDSPKLEIVKLPLAYLKEKNHLKMYTDAPSLAFWSKNFYDITDVVFKLEFNKVNSKAARYFTLSKIEKDNLLGSSLEFFIYCEEGVEGFSSFKIYLNDESVLNELLECEGKEKLVALNRDYLEKGPNQLIFIIDSGKYILGQINVVNEFIGNINPAYTFDISKDELSDAGSIYLKLEFDGTGDRRASIEINDNSINLDTDADEFEVNILDYVNKGENNIEIIPKNSFEIERLLIWYE